MKTNLGFLKTGDFFYFNGVKYKVGHVISNTNSYVACTDVNTKKVKRFYIELEVDVE